MRTVRRPGQLESVYAAALVYELRKRGLRIAAEATISVLYDGMDWGLHFRADLIVEGRVILELKFRAAPGPHLFKITPELPQTDRTTRGITA